MKQIIKKIGLILMVLLMGLTLMTPIFAQSKTVTIHYKRMDNNYEGWNLWVWPEAGDGKEVEFTAEDDYGKIATIEVETDKSIGFIVKRVEGDNIWAEKDVDEDRFIDEFVEDKAEVWLMEGDSDISYTELDGTIQDKFKSAHVTDLKVIKFETTTPFTQADTNSIKVDHYEIDKIVAGTPTTAAIYLKDEIDITVPLSLEFGKFGKTNPSLIQVLHSTSFNDKYAYDGPLGYEYTPEKTIFRLWAPTALQVNLNLEGVIKAMTLGEKGVWTLEVQGDLLSQKYTYQLEFVDGTTSESVDPYSYAVTANSQETVIVTNHELSFEGWDATDRMKPFSGPQDAIIWEAHVRDLTIGPDNGISNKGKFLGLTEKGTKTEAGNLSGLDYIKSLGVTHVQFLPMYDFASIDETTDLGFGKVYNWGYDPQNYNVPEGSYSTDPFNPVIRAQEMKQMIQTLHDEGLYVIMDVVYNHVFDVSRSPFHKTVPGYYFRYDNNGKLKNGTGVGNETASEQPMFRRYMIESLKYWAQEYNLDGFRFDLMGIHDIETMKQVREALNEVDPSLILLGEGWDMGTMASNLKANQKNADKLPTISFFNDSFRDGVKGSVFNAAEPGLVNGANSKEKLVYNNLVGGQNLDPNSGKYTGAHQLVQYVEAHDNLTLYDKLLATNPGDDDKLNEQRHNLATSLVFLAQGMPFIHAGQEILRTKDGDHNSYISNDTINVFDYDRVLDYPESLELFKNLVNLRKEHSVFRQTDYEQIAKSAKLITTGDQFIHYELTSDEGTYVIAINASPESKSFELGYESMIQLFNGTDFSEKEVTNDKDIVIEGLTAMVLVSSQNQMNWTWILVGVIGLLLLLGLLFLMKRNKKV